MPAIEIPDPLPPAITLPRTVIEFAVGQHLEQFGETGIVARTWRWILHGGGSGPISRTDWSAFDGAGPPSAATLAAESTASQPPLLSSAAPSQLNQARFVCWWCAADPHQEVPMRFRAWDTALEPAEGMTFTHHP